VASSRLLVKPSAVKEIEALPRLDRPRIVAKISSLARDPRPQGSEKLSGRDQYRLRHGNYRILYEIHDLDLVVVVVTTAAVCRKSLVGHSERTGPASASGGRARIGSTHRSAAADGEAGLTP
jgi:mRNA interferase RelE/StbE